MTAQIKATGTTRASKAAVLPDYRKSDVATLCNVSERLVDRWLARKVVPGAYKLGQLVRFKRQAIDQWREAGCPGL